MNTSLDLKEIEKRAFRSTYQDGLWDIYYGLIVIILSLVLYRQAEGYGWLNLISGCAGYFFAYGLFRAAKRYITIPRLGQVVFGEIRKQKKRTMSIILGVFIFLQTLMVCLPLFGYLNADFGEKLGLLFGGSNDLFLVAGIASLMVCISMAVIANFSDFLRGYAIAILMSLAVFLMIFLNQPVFSILIGIMILLPGVMLLMRFLKRYPLAKNEAGHE